MPPRLTDPSDGAVIDTLRSFSTPDGEETPGVIVDLVWEDDTNCLPTDGYRVEVSTSPGFPHDSRTNAWNEESGLHAIWFIAPWVDWEECQQYYWRVTGLMPEPERDQMSETFTFIINTAGLACPAFEVGPVTLGPGVGLPPLGHAAISGHVWHDECAVPDETPSSTPPGCISLSDGGLEANGVLDPSEGGIAGVTVHLSPGSCPGDAGRTDATDSSGQIGFYNLAAGDYCVWVDALADGNDAVLIPGGWTAPERGVELAVASVTLANDDDIRRDLLFGWDFQFLPAPAPSTPAASIPASITTLQNAHCRLGPSLVFNPAAILEQGDTAPIQGKNREATWWFVMPSGLRLGCWVWGGAVETSGDLSQVPHRASPPTPEPTPEPEGCWVFNAQQQQVCVVPCPDNAVPGGSCEP